MTVTRKVLPRKRLKRKVPFGARPGGVMNPERYPVKPKIPRGKKGSMGRTKKA